MRAAILREYGEVPVPGEFDEPVADGPRVVVPVVLAGLNPVDRSIASGSFYGGSPPLPYVPGREAIVTLPDGAAAYVDDMPAPFGAFAEQTLADPGTARRLPDGLDPGLALAFGVAGTAAWLALDWRARLQPGEHVVVLGATGTVGALAVQAAKLLRAGRVVAVARPSARLDDARSRGADATVPLDPDLDVATLSRRLQEAAEGRIDIVVDPVWGMPAVAAIDAASFGARVVQLGQSAGATAELASAAIRGKLLTILGHTNFAAPPDVRAAAFDAMAAAGARGELDVPHEVVPLDRIADAWERQAAAPGTKLVIRP